MSVLCSFEGHHQTNRAKVSLTSPRFSGDHIVTGGDGTCNLYRYSLVTEKLESCVYVGHTPTALLCVGTEGEQEEEGKMGVLTAHGKTAVYYFEC